MSKIGILSDAHLFHRWSQPQLYKKTIQELQDVGVDFIVDCGDLTDSNILNSVQSEILYDVFSIVKVPMHIVMGNHDSLGGTSLASILKMNANITVHTDIEVVDDMLFIPYTNSKRELKSNLDSLDLLEPVSLAFSHLMMLDNKYAMIPFNSSKFLHKYADTIFNGHIHDYSECKTIFGTIYNVGSFSNLTFGEKDTPHYHIYDTETKELKRYQVNGGIVHKTIIIENVDDINKLESQLDSEHAFKYNWRIKLPADFDFKNRSVIREILYKFSCTNNVQFDYLTSLSQLKQKTEANIIIQKSKNKQSLLEQLFSSYENYSNVKLDDNVKKQLKG